jgi:JmjC domain, hydroxylase
MRRILDHCRSLVDNIVENGGHQFRTATKLRLLPDAIRAATADAVNGRRERALAGYCPKEPIHPAAAQIDTVETLSDLSVQQFYERFLVPNRPCLVKDARRHFQPASALWTTTTTKSGTSTSTIRPDWFLETLGGAVQVPVTVPCCVASQAAAAATTTTAETATETTTTTISMPLAEWTALVSSPEQMQERFGDGNNMPYLKDWHLLYTLQNFTAITDGDDDDDVIDAFRGEAALYTVPDHFRYDLLNGTFASQFVPGCHDLRFVYWGPAGSRTGLHSDVLNSFSWSYNVCGRKQWTLHPPAADGAPPIRVHQGPGELVFVPSTWKHSVLNTTETLSINHNWVTPANIDYMYECLRSEIRRLRGTAADGGGAVVVVDGIAGEEHALEELYGYNTSIFFFLLLERGLQLLGGSVGEVEAEPSPPPLLGEWVTSFELIRLQHLLRRMVRDDAELPVRLEAGLLSKYRTDDAIAMAATFVEEVDRLVAAAS